MPGINLPNDLRKLFTLLVNSIPFRFADRLQLTSNAKMIYLQHIGRIFLRKIQNPSETKNKQSDNADLEVDFMSRYIKPMIKSC